MFAVSDHYTPLILSYELLTLQRIVDEWELLDALGLRRNHFTLYLMKIEAGYLDNAYHCSAHAADVTTRLATMLNGGGDALELFHWNFGRFLV